MTRLNFIVPLTALSGFLLAANTFAQSWDLSNALANSPQQLQHFESQTLKNISIPAPVGLQKIGEPLLQYSDSGIGAVQGMMPQFGGNFLPSMAGVTAGLTPSNLMQPLTQPLAQQVQAFGSTVSQYAQHIPTQTNAFSGASAIQQVNTTTPLQCKIGCMQVTASSSNMNSQCEEACGVLIQTVGNVPNVQIDWLKAGLSAGAAVKAAMSN